MLSITTSQSTEKTRIGNNIHSCLATLSFLCSMIVDEHITSDLPLKIQDSNCIGYYKLAQLKILLKINVWRIIYASTKVSEKIHDMRFMNNIKFSNWFEGEKYKLLVFMIVVKLLMTAECSQVGKEFHGPAVHWRVGRKKWRPSRN